MTSPAAACAAVLILGAGLTPLALVPARAQEAPQAGSDIPEALSALRARVAEGVAAGQLSTGLADDLAADIGRIRAAAETDRDRHGELTADDRAELLGRIDAVSRRIHEARAEAIPAPPRPEAAPPPAPPAAEAAAGAWPLREREAYLAQRIDRGLAEGRLSGVEAQRGWGEIAAVRQEESRLLARDGGALSPEDFSYLANRVDELNATLRWQGRNPPPPWGASE